MLVPLRIRQVALRWLSLAVVVVSQCLCPRSEAQTLNLPPRASNAPTGSEFINQIKPLSRDDRENAIYAQISNGNVPNWMRSMTLIGTNAVINGTTHTISYYVTPDY